MEQLSKLQILDETIKFYSEDVSRRAFEYNSCVYNTEDGRHCAVGRCLLPKYHEQGIKLEGNNNGLTGLMSKHLTSNVDELLQEQYRGHSFGFWSRLQSIHDARVLWSETGLSEEGLERVADFKIAINRGDFN